ncbi:MAG: hypothetical protein Kow0037_21120 [Calditrichia bacterium]
MIFKNFGVANIILLFMLLLSSCEKVKEPVGSDDRQNKVNVATILLNYQTLQVEGINIRSFATPQVTNGDSLPVRFTLKSPLDFGDALFQLVPGGDTLFYGTVIWHGKGEIMVPGDWQTEVSWSDVSDGIREPLSFNYYQDSAIPVQPNEWARVWETVKKLEVTKNFSQYPYRVGMYVYPPEYYLNMASAKWVVFLYYEMI